MLAFIEKFGFEAINAKAMCGLKSDKVLQASFGAKTLERNSREALFYYLDDVRREASFLTGT